MSRKPSRITLALVTALSVAVPGCISLGQPYRHLGKKHMMTTANRDYHKKVITEVQRKHGILVGTAVDPIDESGTDARLTEQSEQLSKQSKVYEAVCDDLRRAVGGSPDGDGFTSAGRLLQLDANQACDQAAAARKSIDRIASLIKGRRDAVEKGKNDRVAAVQRFMAGQMPDIAASAARIRAGEVRNLVLEDKSTATVKCQGLWAQEFAALGILSDSEAEKCGAVRSEYLVKLKSFLEQRDAREDDSAWEQANAAACRSPESENACGAVDNYVSQCPPFERHCDEARKAIAIATPKLNALRVRREAAEAAEAKREAAEAAREAAREAAEERRAASRGGSSSRSSGSVDSRPLACCSRCGGSVNGTDCEMVNVVCYNACMDGGELPLGVFQ